MTTDLIVGLVILISAGLAFFRGFIREALTILGVVGGLAAAYFYGDDFTPFYLDFFGVTQTANLAENESPAKFMGLLNYEYLAKGLGYASVFLLVVIFLSVVSFFLSRFVEKIGLGMIDRTLGVVFGIIRGVILLALVYLALSMFLEPDEKEEWFSESRSIIYIEWTSEWIANFLPESFMEDDVAGKVEGTREKLKMLEILPSSDVTPENQDPTPSIEEGYLKEERNSLYDLIEEQEQQSPESGPLNE